MMKQKNLVSNFIKFLKKSFPLHVGTSGEVVSNAHALLWVNIRDLLANLATCATQDKEGLDNTQSLHLPDRSHIIIFPDEI